MSTGSKPQIISITGTKGKSTIAYVLADILGASRDLLRVDTTGYYINGMQKGTLSDSLRVSSLVPTVSPGRFLTAMQDYSDFTAVLECSLGSSNAPGLGYSYHNIGIFTNVFEDHIGSTSRLRSREDIAVAKNFIFSRINPEGYAVFNADDELVCSQLHLLKSTVTKIPCGVAFTHFDIEQHLRDGGVAVTLENGFITLKTQDTSDKIVTIADISWTFKGQYEPSVKNLLLIVGALWAANKGVVSAEQRKLLTNSKLAPDGGRLTPLRSKDGVTIIADYAHEKYSLAAIGDLAGKIKDSDSNKVVGVVRLAYDRTDDLINDTASHIAPHFDEFVVYDKIDGFWRKPKKTIGSFKMKIGYISQVLTDSLTKNGANVTRIIREDEAIAHAALIAKPGDIVVIIVNDNIRQSLDFIREKFNADYV